MSELLKAALQYQARGLSIFPANNEKKPRIEWGKYQKEIATKEQIEAWWTKWPSANIAIVTGKLSNLTIIDVDSEDAYKMIQDYLPDSFITTIAKSPKGYHIYCKYFDKAVNKSQVLKDVDIRTEGGYIIAPPSTNGAQSRYTWFCKGLLGDIPDLLKKIIIDNNISFSLSRARARGGEGDNHKSQVVTPVTSGHKKIGKGQRDDKLFHLANYLAKANMPVEEIQQYLTLMGLHCCEPPFPKGEINTKIQSALDRSKNQEKNIAHDVREWVQAVGGHFTSQDVHREIHSVTQSHKHAANVELTRLEKQGILERCGTKRGQYRLIESACEFEDFKGPAIKNVDIKLPLGIESLVEIMPGEILIFAGVTNFGKTTFLLDVVRQNMDKHNVYYFSTELNKYALNKRLRDDPYISLKDWNFKFSSNFENFIDIIQPEGITIVDYIEETEGEYWKIPSLIGKMHKKLKGGVCITALQKHPHKDHGAGGFGTMNKPSLYCLLDYDRSRMSSVLEIVKGKNWAVRGKNPKSYKRNFKILDGIQLLTESIWYLDEEEGLNV